MDVNAHATSKVGSMGNFAKFLRDVVEKNKDQFRVFGPDETQSNKLGEIYEVRREAFGHPKHNTNQWDPD